MDAFEKAAREELKRLNRLYAEAERALLIAKRVAETHRSECERYFEKRRQLAAFLGLTHPTQADELAAPEEMTGAEADRIIEEAAEEPTF